MYYMDVLLFFVFSGKNLFYGPIPRPEESCRVCVCVCFIQCGQVQE
jgi:hypothetical protein